jgi:hypothetical protein
MCIFFDVRMAATILDMQKMYKNGMNCTKKVEAPDTHEAMNPKNWFTLKPLKPVATPCDGNAKSKSSVMIKRNNLSSIMGALKPVESHFNVTVLWRTSF